MSTRLVLAALGAVVLGALFIPSGARGAESKLSGVVWTDGDHDGVRDPGEPGRGGVRVELLRAGKRGQLTVVRGIRTKRSGAWSAPLGSPGSYRARVLLPGGFAGFSPRNRGNDRADSDVAVSGPRVGMTPRVRLQGDALARRFDAGLLASGSASAPPVPLGPLVTIGDFVWRDEDGDGVQDPVDEGLGGVTIELWDPAKATLLATTTSNAAGFWSLPGHAGSSYRVRVASIEQPSPLHVGADPARDSDLNPSGPDAGFSEVFAPAASTADLDIGLYMGVGDFVWDDKDSDGVQDPGEPGIAGVIVQLWNGAKSFLADSDTTDASGHFRLLAPAIGQYRVRALLPSGFSGYSPKDAGSDDQLDSDLNPSGANESFTDPFNLLGGLDRSLDVGIL